MKTNQKWTRSSRHALRVAGALSALAGCAPDATVHEVGSAAEPIIGGTATTTTTHRRAIGSWGGCTATLIDDDWVLLASHCWDYLDSIDGSSSAHNSFTTSTDGRSCTSGTCPSIETERTIALSLAPGGGAGDVMIARLKSPVSATFTAPIAMATAHPTSGTVTFWGQSNSNTACTTGFGQIRFREVAWNSTSNILCPGDSGGPRTVGARAALGPVDFVNSWIWGWVGSDFSTGTMNGGDVVLARSRINDIIAEWNVNGPADISATTATYTGFCTHPTATLYYGDVNADGELDAICHDTATGNRWVATGRNRLIRQTAAYDTSSFCGGAGQRLFVGDFNGDRRTDLLCRQSTGAIQIDYASGTGAYNTTGAADWSTATAWCTHASGKLLTGDFNGDGRTDLLCHDTATGHQWWDLADTSGRFGTQDGEAAGPWCSHGGAALYVGEFNGDGRSDLLCHSGATDGGLWVQYSAGGAAPFDGVGDFALAGPEVTAASCASSAGCAVGQVCASGLCRESLCVATNSALTVADYSGDGLSDVLCTYYATDGDGNSRNDRVARTHGYRAWGGSRGSGTGSVFATGQGFGAGHGLRIRSVNAATQPIERARATTTR